MKKTSFIGLLLMLWVLVVVGGGLGRIYWLGKLTSNNGPQALAADGSGGFYLLTNHNILHLNSTQQLVDSHTADSIGIGNLNAIAVDGHTLWLFDADTSRIVRCSLGWQCATFGPATLGLGHNVQLAVSHETPQRLIIADNKHHRLLTLDAGTGALLDDGHQKQHLFPNQVTASADGILLADTNKLQITQLGTDLNSDGTVVLKTTSLPYHFVQRGNDWWVIESGPLLQDGLIRHYRTPGTNAAPADALAAIAPNDSDTATSKPHGHVVQFEAADPVALVDTPDGLVLASRDDWNVLTLDPQTDIATPFGDSDFQGLLTHNRLEKRAAELERSRWPYIMLGLMLPALIGGMLLQKRLDAEKQDAMSPLH